MSDLKKWRVTGPDGFDVAVVAPTISAALNSAYLSAPNAVLSTSKLMHLAGYRADPIEEPKMVTVRADDVNTILLMPGLGWADAVTRLRAALEDDK